VTEFFDQTMKLGAQRGEVFLRLLRRRVSWMTWSQTAHLAIDALLLGTDAAQDREPIVAAQDVVEGTWLGRRFRL
jgi:hypothetical protein